MYVQINGQNIVEMLVINKLIKCLILLMLSLVDAKDENGYMSTDFPLVNYQPRHVHIALGKFGNCRKTGILKYLN